MEIRQNQWTRARAWAEPSLPIPGEAAQLVLIFGSRYFFKDQSQLKEIRAAFPQAILLGCSTAGEIMGTRVLDDSRVTTAIHFRDTAVCSAQISVRKTKTSFEAGVRLAQSLDPVGLVHVFMLSEGLNVNGSELVAGLTSCLPEGVTVTGGLSADGDRFEQTVVLWDSAAERDSVAVVGFYGDRLQIGYGSLGGWDSFGPERLVTRARDNVLYELDGKSALELYKRYLGEHADGLPATGLLFPLSIRSGEREVGVVRTILSVNEVEQSLTFAGNVPVGAYARLMKANFDRLIDGAAGAARISHDGVRSPAPDLALLISCVGRRLVLKQRIEEEVEAVRDVFGERTALTGFYSYGEISPFVPGAKWELHNQTMTITTFTEA